MTRKRDPWARVAQNAWPLGLEASTVIGLRTLKVAAGGPGARAELASMVSEKIEAGMALQTLAMTGGLGLTAPEAAARTLSHYRKKVRANRRRLTKL